MGRTLDLGRRIELQSLDEHCGDISIGLYCHDIAGVPHFLVHTYSSFEGAEERVAFLRQTLISMAGLVQGPEPDSWLRFPCEHAHERALKRVFLDFCKFETSRELVPKPLKMADKKAECDLTVVSVDGGVYRVEPDAGAAKGPKRAEAVTKGFVKLCEMETVNTSTNEIAFSCKHEHDALMGALFFRAQNVRASFREQEEAGGRGVLSAPSQQK